MEVATLAHQGIEKRTSSSGYWPEGWSGRSRARL